MLPHIRTLDGVTILLHNAPVDVSCNHAQYENIIDALLADADDDEISGLINKIAREVERVCQLSGSIAYSGGVVTYNGHQLHGYAVDKLIALINADKPAKALTNFLEKLQHNPSNQTVENLYQFLEFGKIPLNEAGNFLVYKAVRKDYKDIHSGKFDNSLGAVNEMPRSQVNDNREQTCSHGLHVCSFDYLPHFASANGHVMVCEVSPADVVSIPTDYNNTKMRVCKYKVVGEVEDYYDKHEDVLGGLEVWDEEYVIQAKEYIDEDWTVIGTSDSIEDAIEAAEEEFMLGGDNGENWMEVRVINSSGVTVWQGN